MVEMVKFNVRNTEYYTIPIAQKLTEEQYWKLFEQTLTYLCDKTGYDRTLLDDKMMDGGAYWGNRAIGVPTAVWDQLLPAQQQDYLYSILGALYANDTNAELFKSAAAIFNKSHNLDPDSGACYSLVAPELGSKESCHSIKYNMAHSDVDASTLPLLVKYINELMGKPVAFTKERKVNSGFEKWAVSTNHWTPELCIKGEDMPDVVLSPHKEAICYLLAKPEEILTQSHKSHQKIEEILRAGKGGNNRPGATTWAIGAPK